MRLAFSRFALVVLLACLGVSTGWAGPSTDQLRSEVDAVLRTLDDATLKGPAHRQDRLVAVQKIMDTTIDYREAARRALGRHWAERTEAERAEFIGLFRNLVERSYLSKLDLYSGEKIVYLGEQAERDRSIVRTRVTSSGQGNESVVDFHMAQDGDRWWVHDVVVDGASLTDNYRTQFNAVIRRSSYPELVKKIKTMTTERSGR